VRYTALYKENSLTYISAQWKDVVSIIT